MKDGEIAKRTRVSRKTINLWRNHDADFRTRLAQRRKVMFEAHQDELNGLISEAIGVMREAMLEENMQVRIRAAQEVLRTAGLRMAMKAEAPASREEIINEFLGEMIKNSTMEMGIVEAKQLGSGEEGT